MSICDLLMVLILFITGPVNEPSYLWAEEEFVRLRQQPVVTVDDQSQEFMRLSFQVQPGYHIMSNKVKNENFLTAELRLTGNDQIQFGPATFPPSEEKSLQGSEEPIQVFSDTFLVEVAVMIAATADKGVYPVNGVLFHQACTDTKCFFPKELAFQVTLKIE